MWYVALFTLRVHLLAINGCWYQPMTWIFFFLLQNSNKLAFTTNWGRFVHGDPLPLRKSTAEKRPKWKCILRRKHGTAFIHFCELISWQQRLWLNCDSLYCLWELSSFICLISLLSGSRISTFGSVSCARSLRIVKKKSSCPQGKVLLCEFGVDSWRLWMLFRI